MKNKPNEWVSISDLMAGVMAVVMLMLVISVVQNQFAAAKRQEEKRRGEDTEQRKLTTLLREMRATMEGQGDSDLLDFNEVEGKITLRDRVFGRGSACVIPEARLALSRIAPKIAAFIGSSSQTQVSVQGHTDNLKVLRPVTDYARYCTVYDDNITLSAARAREARILLIQALSEEQARRVIVAGLGDSQPLPGIPPEDERNRRVEVQFANRLALKGQ